jgi:hypothetical protein
VNAKNVSNWIFAKALARADGDKEFLGHLPAVLLLWQAGQGLAVDDSGFGLDASKYGASSILLI